MAHVTHTIHKKSYTTVEPHDGRSGALPINNNVAGRCRWILSFVSLGLLALIYICAVLTPIGQALENAALRGAAGVIIGGQIITQILKRFILPRQPLVEVVGDYSGNSFPSGHTTIAITVLVAVLLVVPFRFRGIAMFLVIPWATGIGAYTITAKWHRFSDALGADMIALLLGSLAVLVLLRMGRIKPAKTRPKLRVIYAVAVSIAGVSALVLGAFLGASVGTMPLDTSIVEWNAYLAAHSLASGCSILTAIIFWASWRHLEAT
ncbi:membrane-associated phospholipid phosphatase [Leucobacter exalbidus]|uniref:Membrane-associated phospholipid phosphatase n=1 Tax=Leucobacter exalbidus TaxID=662960 RepID=A0A940PMN9_9MICO|nr:phosphatase PAP2 family protein [Leucobacter exalbidus]MBP1325915.1 membrane-associated phospholipid phosphatase [Leucobacter exalbidus]